MFLLKVIIILLLIFSPDVFCSNYLSGCLIVLKLNFVTELHLRRKPSLKKIHCLQSVECGYSILSFSTSINLERNLSSVSPG